MTTTQTMANAPTADAPRGGTLWAASLGLAGLALVLSGYLAFASLTGDGRPAGCGDAAGCGAVLGTKWGSLLGLPVSVFAAGLYAVVLAVLLVRRQRGGLILSAAAAAIVGAAAWFVYLQLFEVQAICKYCMADHALGVALAVLLLTGDRGRTLAAGVAVGLLGSAAMAGLQWASSEPVFVVDGGGGQRDGRTVTLLEGGLTLDLKEEMVLGDPANPRLMVKMFDYNCPHCRHAHEVMADIADVSVVLLPVPLNPTCNAYQPDLPLPQFAHSCDIAKIAMAVHQLDPTKLKAFDDWAYSEGWPHTAEDARAFAATLVDGLSLDLKLANPELDQQLQRNTQAWGQARSREIIGGLPVHLVPGGGLTYGGVGDGTSLRQLLDGTHYSQQHDDASPTPPDTPATPQESTP